MLSNSNPKNTNKEDSFFENIYKGFKINEVSARRMINSNCKGRGEISELLITNYEETIECIQANSTMKMVASN
jgi:DNA adenine methylase